MGDMIASRQCECGGNYVFAGNSWERFAFNHEQYAWNYVCDKCGYEWYSAEREH